MPMPAMDEFMGSQTRGSGHWMTQLLPVVGGADDVELGVVATWTKPESVSFERDGVKYYLIGYSGNWLSRKMQARRGDVDLGKCVEAIDDFRPDLIHIHGTERGWGLLAYKGLTDRPVLLTMQGLMDLWHRNYFGSLTWSDILRCITPSELLRGSSLIHLRARLKQAAQRERDILRSVQWFTGQTDCDAFRIHCANPSAEYYRVWRVLRPPFYVKRWQLDRCRKHSIIFTNARNPGRDTECLVKAVEYLRQDFPDVKLKIAGPIPAESGYGRFVHRYVGRLGGAVELLGWVDAERLSEELCSSHVYAIASHVDTESNALCEAMLVGMPCVASYAGGLTTTLEEGRGGMFFPPGDAAVLAGRIRSIFENDDLACSMAQKAHEIAVVRHDPHRVGEEQLSAYRDILAKIAAQQQEEIRRAGSRTT